jgi:hypothetical protein
MSILEIEVKEKKRMFKFLDRVKCKHGKLGSGIIAGGGDDGKYIVAFGNKAYWIKEKELVKDEDSYPQCENCK